MKSLSKLRLTSKVEILNEKEMKHLKGGYSGYCWASTAFEACNGKDYGNACSWTDRGTQRSYGGKCGIDGSGSTQVCHSDEY